MINKDNIYQHLYDNGFILSDRISGNIEPYELNFSAGNSTEEFVFNALKYRMSTYDYMRDIHTELYNTSTDKVHMSINNGNLFVSIPDSDISVHYTNIFHEYLESTNSLTADIKITCLCLISLNYKVLESMKLSFRISTTEKNSTLLLKEHFMLSNKVFPELRYSAMSPFTFTSQNGKMIGSALLYTPVSDCIINAINNGEINHDTICEYIDDKNLGALQLLGFSRDAVLEYTLRGWTEGIYQKNKQVRRTMMTKLIHIRKSTDV